MDTPRRKDLRLKSWDYSCNSCYHVTICSKNRELLFGDVSRTEIIEKPWTVKLSELGECCERILDSMADPNNAAVIENYVVMPNHLHVLVWLIGDSNGSCPISLQSFVRYLKSSITKSARSKGFTGEIWQKGYYERIIRNDDDFFAVWEYIDANPSKWGEDEYYRDSARCPLK